jgi:DnaJ-class molecular chaperone
MTDTIRKAILSSGFLICPSCDGEGEIGYFCGHESSSTCYFCAGHGMIRSLKKVKQRRECYICQGKGCLGGCDNKGYHEWESYELI